MIRDAYAWLMWPEGSTRPAALLRILLVFLAWSCWGAEMRAFDSREAWHLLLSAVFWPSTLLLCIGLFTRYSAAAAGITVLLMYYLGGFVYGNQENWTHHHQYILTMAIFFLAFVPSGKSYSVDRWLAVRRAEARGEPLPEERGYLWGLRLIGFQVCASYFWGAFDKTTLVWFSGARMEHYWTYFYAGSTPTGFLMHAFLVFQAWFVVVLEYALAFGLFVPRLRRILLPLGVLLHVLFYLLIPVGTFSLTCIAMYVAFLDQDAVHRLIDQLSGAVSQRLVAPDPKPIARD